MIEVEGKYSYMYLDGKGNVTVGIGHLVPDESAAKTLAFQYRRDQLDGDKNVTNKKDEKAGSAAKAAEYNLVKKKFVKNPDKNKGEKTPSAIDFATLTELILSDKEIDKLFQGDFNSALTEIKKKFTNFDKLPESAQLGLLDMEFNMGINFSKAKWPKLFKAVEEKNWATVKTECNRPEVQDSRNSWTKARFQEAAGSAAAKTDPEPLNRPRTDSGANKKKSSVTTPPPVIRPRQVPPR
jgi:GH24 family phage-related lysozyme (muramidase)